MKRSGVGWVAVGAALLIPGGAFAQVWDEPEEAPPPPVEPAPAPDPEPFSPTPRVQEDERAPEVRERRAEWEPASRIGAAVLLGGGYGNFVEQGIRDQTGGIGSWHLRVVSGTRQLVGLELAYVGGINDVTGPGLGDDEFLMRNGIEGSLRLNAPIVSEATMVAPFAFAGLGWQRFSLVNAGPDVTIGTRDDVLTVPLGAGVALGFRGLMLDARFTYRPTYNDDLFGALDMHTWGVTGSLGGEF
jgi:hypothetical protein